MAMIQVGVAPCSIQAVACVSRVNSDSNAFPRFFLALNPDPKNLPKLDPKDQYLLDSTAGSSLFVSTSAPGSSSSHSVPTVTWLRKTEYITSREGTNRPSSTPDQYVPSSCHFECRW